VIQDVVAAGGDAIGEPVIADKLSDVFLRVQFGAFGRRRDDGDVVGHDQLGREVPSGLIEQEHRMPPRRDLCGDLRQVQVHRRCIAVGEDQAGRESFRRADGAEDVGRGGALVFWRRWARSTFAPAPCDLVLLCDPGFVAEPKFYVRDFDTKAARDGR
jgi:hypothetical protein